MGFQLLFPHLPPSHSGSLPGENVFSKKLFFLLNVIILGMPVRVLDVGLKNTTNIRPIERGLVVMGCVVRG